METYEAVKSAIQSKSAISAVYDKLPRLLCPHVIGTKGGTEQYLAWQYGGETSKGEISNSNPANWKCLKISKLSDVQLINDSWHTGDNHSQTQTCVDAIDVEIAY